MSKEELIEFIKAEFKKIDDKFAEILADKDQQMYKKCFAEYKSYNKYLMHLWTDDDYTTTEWSAPAYIECDESEAKYRGLNNEPLKKIYKWKRDMEGLHFHDMSPYQNLDLQ